MVLPSDNETKKRISSEKETGYGGARDVSRGRQSIRQDCALKERYERRNCKSINMT